MTNITGKIYQMQNAAGTENRFPRTVMEAVLGLNSYLQDQFSALANIYMPIEGISEAFTGQEFVYRKSPNTIKAKSLTLDRIKGKSLAWNQHINLNITINPTIRGVTRTTVGNHFHLQGTATDSNYGPVFNWIGLNSVVGHKYLYLFRFSGQGASSLKVGDQYQNFTQSVDSFIQIASTDTFIIAQSYITNGVEYDCDAYINLFDLTLMFGSGNEPSTVEEFEAMFPGYHDYNPGTLISNDAEALETTGVNQWDEEWELGTYDSAGEKASSTTQIRCKNFIKVVPNSTYFINKNDFSVFRGYDADKNCVVTSIPYTEQTNGYLLTIGANVSYVTFYMLTSYGTTYNHDICINLSDESINGQYFPYWKRTLNLGLNEFKVKDSQGNITTITGGLKSAGSVYDEIVGNKYVKRVGSVDLGTLEWSYNATYLVFIARLSTLQNGQQNAICSAYDNPYNGSLSGMEDKTLTTRGAIDNHNIIVKDSAYTDAAAFKAAMSGVMLYYELATPIEYELAEPLVPTVKAGTTEARISPNADGLSAPFRADITYSASENNDAGNAQYAATAGRLLNTRKIWGQDFNGSEDVDGNLVSNGILQGTQLKSTVPTGTAPLVVSSTTTVENLVAEKASKLLTARTIWGRSFDGSNDISGALEGVTTISASGLATIAGGIALGTSANAQTARLVWDETNNAWHLQGNLYADGFLTAGGINSGNDAATLIFGQNLSSSGETFSISAGLYDAPNDEYFTVPSSDSAQDLDTGHILATKADIDTINARIQLIVDNNALFEPTE